MPRPRIQHPTRRPARDDGDAVSVLRRARHDRAPAPPAGDGREHVRVALPVDFAAARAAVMRFVMHALDPLSATAREGLDVIVSARVGPLWTTNPCRVVYVEDLPDRYT